jgi:hypothetical protein
MNESNKRANATIYAFPARGRFRSSPKHAHGDVPVASSPAVSQTGWYHDMAIVEELKERPGR